MDTIVKGSVESLLVALRDRLNNLTDASTLSSPLFYVHDEETDAAVQPDTPWTVDPDFPMTAICEVDTTLVAYVKGKTYNLYLKYTTGSEHPVLGPEPFRVV
jgi:hypothetical protein